MRHPVFVLLLLLIGSRPAAAQQSFYSHDNYTQYELLEPGSGKFAITYYVTERRAGSLFILNQTRSGSEGTDIGVVDPRTGKPLKFDYMTGAELTAAGMTGRFSAEEHYIRAHLPRPVPEKGEGRAKILKTYKDEKSYYVEGEEIVFRRSLGNARNSIVLPKGYHLVSSNVASQMFTLADGRLKVSFEHPNAYAADVTIRGRAVQGVLGEAPIALDRAFDSVKTLFDIADPQSARIAVTHEYLESASGEEARLRLPAGLAPQFTVTDVDAGQALQVSRRGDQAVARLMVPITAPGQSARLRIAGDLRGNFRMLPNAFEWELAISGARAVVLLPPGWEVAAVSVPATVTTQPDSRVAIQIYNPDPGVRRVTLRAAKR
jgi:hypothetical protein